MNGMGRPRGLFAFRLTAGGVGPAYGGRGRLGLGISSIGGSFDSEFLLSEDFEHKPHGIRQKMSVFHPVHNSLEPEFHPIDN